jgi:hypothetical protein
LKFIDETLKKDFVTYLGWRRIVRALFGVNYGNLVKLNSGIKFALGSLRKAF